MNVTQLWDRLAGGALPLFRRQPREVFVVDGVQHSFRVTWLRRGLEIAYTTPRYPRDVRRVREAERLKLAESVRRREAGEPLTQVGDVLPEHRRYIPVQVTRCRDGQYDEWRRAVGDECYPRDDVTGELDRSQAYEWVQENHHAGRPAEISGHATDEGVLTHHPVVVLEISDEVPA